MEDLYSIHPTIPRSAQSDLSDLIKAQIVSHPRYPSLVSAYIDCRKVGAPPETASVLEDIVKERSSVPICSHREIGSDPELDEFMESYFQVLIRFKEELSKPFEEATTFLTKMEMQLGDLCQTKTSNSTITNAVCNSPSDWGSSEGEEMSCGETDRTESQEEYSLKSGNHELKAVLLKKYSGYLGTLRKEFLKKRKKGMLPKDSKLILLDWWNTHYRWPYPTEEEKIKLGEMTGLEPKQINNWFINERKRHWKPSQDMRFALIDGVSSGGSGGNGGGGGGDGGGGGTLHFDTGTFGP